MNWLPRGKFKGACQALYDRLLIHPQATRDLDRLLDTIRPEVICVGSLSSCDWVVPAAMKWRANIKVIVYVHGEEVPRGTGFFNRLRLQALLSATAIVAVSSFTRNALDPYRRPPQRITVITNGVDTARFKPGKKSQGVTDRYGLANRRVLMTSRGWTSARVRIW